MNQYQLLLALIVFSLPLRADEGELEQADQLKSTPETTVPADEVVDVAPAPVASDAAATENPMQPVASYALLDNEVVPGTRRRLSWYASENSAGLSEPTPVLVAHGASPGPTLCLTAAVHGDELNGIEIVRQLLYEVNPERLNGTLIGVPIVNLHGFRLGSRYLSDRRDLNRYFPGNPDGSSASRIAYSLFESVISHCDYLVDLHTGSFQRANLPQLRADLNHPDVMNMTRGFGATVVLHGAGPDGSLRGAATQAGIPAVTVEAGEPMRVQTEQVEHGLKALRSLLNYLDMVPRFTLWGEPQPIYYKSRWVRAEQNGILNSNVNLGDDISEDQLLGHVVDPITNSHSEIRSPVDGRVIGMALNQSMRPGYAAYHIGIRKTEDQIVEEADVAATEEDDDVTADGDAAAEDAVVVDSAAPAMDNDEIDDTE